MRLYALHDLKSGALSSFHAAKNDAVATRGFASGVTEQGSVMGKYPDDFQLICIAELSEEADAPELVSGFGIPEGSAFEVVVTARQVVDLQRPAADQLSLLKEA